MAALADPPEAEYSYVDRLSFMFPANSGQNITFYFKMLTSTQVVHEKTLFRLEPSLN